MMFRFPSVICTRCTGFFCLAIIKGPPNDIYCIIEEPYKHYFTEKVSYSRNKSSWVPWQILPVQYKHTFGYEMLLNIVGILDPGMLFPVTI
mgnify:CR=1 FL=1